MTQGKPFIRPEDAQSMLREATPGPWQARGDGPSAGHPHFYICTCEDRAHVAENVYYRNARLLTYAPDLAEVVANLRYEYAVQLNDHRDRGADWWYWKDNMRTQWFTDYEEAVNVAESIPERARVVRRLVGDVEVEP